MSRRMFVILLTGLMIIALSLSACGSTAATQPAQPSDTAAPAATHAPASTDTPAATSTPRPTLTPVANPNPSGLFPVGDYKPLVGASELTGIKFSADGTYALTLINSVNVTEVITGVYVVTGDKIVLNENPGFGCSGFPGTFTWSFDVKLLRLKPVQDACQRPRSHDLGRQWTRQP